MYYNLIESSEINDIFLDKTIHSHRENIANMMWTVSISEKLLLWIYSIYLEHKKTKNIEIYHTNANKIWPHLSIKFLYIEQLMSRLKEKTLILGLSTVKKYLTDRGSLVSFKQFHLRVKSCENTAQPCLTMMFQ
jgi:hypothetical protein